MKRTELKRSKPLKSGGSLKRTRIKPRSSKRSAQQKRRLATWEPGETLCCVRWPGECTGLAEGLHERRKSGQGGSREPGPNTMPACNRCNGLIEDEPEDAALLLSCDGRSLVVHEGDPEWIELGARYEREQV